MNAHDSYLGGSDLHHIERSWILLELGTLCDLVGELVIAKFAKLSARIAVLY